MHRWARRRWMRLIHTYSLGRASSWSWKGKRRRRGDASRCCSPCGTRSIVGDDQVSLDCTEYTNSYRMSVCMIFFLVVHTAASADGMTQDQPLSPRLCSTVLCLSFLFLQSPPCGLVGCPLQSFRSCERHRHAVVRGHFPVNWSMVG